MAFHPYSSPLRYPGGKRKLARYLCRTFELNDLCDGDYVEPYCGGASVALAMRYGLYAGRIHLNDRDPAVYAFWQSVLYWPDELCRFVRDTPATMAQWHRQRRILLDPTSAPLEVGQAAFFLNRTNRSGILIGGVIGGQDQAGECRLDDRFNRKDLIRRIEKVARHECYFRLYNLDAVSFLATVASELDERAMVYLDPPYYFKGAGLYAQAYARHEHAAVAQAVARLKVPWVVSYDNVPAIRALYRQYESQAFNLHYSAKERYQGGEIMFFSPGLRRPDAAATAAMLPAPPPPVPVLRPGMQSCLDL